MEIDNHFSFQFAEIDMEKLNQSVVKELEEMKKIGMTVEDEVIEYAKTADLSEYNSMKVGEIADLLIDLR